jgi:hypothetical protein
MVVIIRLPIAAERLNAVRNKSWEEKYVKLVEFKKAHGHVNVPQKPTSHFLEDVDPELSIFCRNLRDQYKLLRSQDTRHRSFLTKDRIDRLEALGFVWNRHDAIWNLRYGELVRFWEVYQHANVPTNWGDNPDLATWVSHQRLRYKGKVGKKPLRKVQLDLLAKVNFRWSPKDEVWWDNYAQLKSFKERYGHFKVSCPKLRRWKTYVRSRCREYVMVVVSIEGSMDGVYVSGLSRERLDALADINFCWMPECATASPPEDIFAGYH